MAARSIGRIHDVFLETATRVAVQSEAQADASRNAGARPWQMPEKGWSGDPLDVPGITAAYARDAIAANYREGLADPTSPGTAGDASSLKVQNDHVAVFERGFRARHCTPVRLAALAAGRRKDHGSPIGVLRGAAVKYATDILKAGQE